MFNHASLFRAIAEALPKRDAVVHGDQRVRYADLANRSNRFANLLLRHGITTHRHRDGLEPWESGQDHVGLYLRNGVPYLEATLGAAAARAVPFNVNYRYVDEELAALLRDASAAALVFHSAFAPTLEAALRHLPAPPLLIQVADASGNALLPGALDYEAALAGSSPGRPPTQPDPSDLYLLYTGGTTGRPKGTLWRQADLFAAVIAPGLEQVAPGISSIEDLVAAAKRLPQSVFLPLAPFMHAAGEWPALAALLTGGRVVIQDVVDRLDPADVWRVVEREQVEILGIVGDAFARPLCAELETSDYDAGSVSVVLSGGAALSTSAKVRIARLLPAATLVDQTGSSESGSLMSAISTPGAAAEFGVFAPLPDTCVISEDRQSILAAGHDGIGWLARRGPIPLGYLGDREASERTFPVIDGRGVAIPGDRARMLPDGTIELLGRDAVTINTGGEKVFAEEVEQVLLTHPAVDDAVVVGAPSGRWGQEVVAIVQLRKGAEVDDQDLVATARARLAGFKTPRQILRVSHLQRSPVGKPDYQWAHDLVARSQGASRAT